jgi:hypothetical protein
VNGRASLVSCLVMVFGAVSSALAGPTVYDSAGTAQNSTIEYFPPRAGVGVVVNFDSFTSGVPGAPVPIANVIRYAYGTRWNGRLFPQCNLVTLRARGPSSCPKGSLFARGYADVPPLRHLVLKAFIATVHEQDAQLFWVSPGIVVVGLLSHNGRAISERIDAHGVPLVEQFHVTDLRRSIHGTPLTVAPAVCPPGGWTFAFVSRFATGPDLVSTNREPCVGP